MDRRSVIKQAGIAAVLGAGIAPAVHARLASSFPKSLDTIYGAAEVFALKVRQLSGGRFEVSVHAAGELMPAFSVVDGVQNAAVEAAHTAPYYFFDKDNTFAMRQHRGADGRLDAQGNQERPGSQGTEVPYRRFRRQGHRAYRRPAAEHSRRRHLPGAEKWQHRRGRMDRALRRPEARFQQGRAVLLLPELVGGRPAAGPVREPPGVRRPCPQNTRPSWKWRARSRMW